MPIDLEMIGAGGGTGIIGAVLAYLGFKRRIERVEADLRLKQNIDVSNALHSLYLSKFTFIEEGQKAIFDEIKSINSFLRNHKIG